MTAAADVTRVLVFAKGPGGGAVKTRLVPHLGPHGAAALHAQLVTQTLATALAAGVGPVELYGAPADDVVLRHIAADYNIGLREQGHGDLGERMHHALDEALRTARRAILVGTDCAVLTAAHLRAAAETLAAGTGAVFAPVEDGGYALVGLSRADPRLFEGVAWSTDRVMKETRIRLRELGRSWTELETLWDIDRPADFERFLALGGAHSRGESGGTRNT